MTQDVQPLTWQKRTNLEEHQQFFSKINEIIDNLAPTVDAAEAAIAQVIVAVMDANASIATANAASAAADAAALQAQTAAATVAGYDTRLTAVEGEADTNAADITALQGRMGTAEGNITALQGRMGTAEGNITALLGVQADYVKKAGAAQTVTSQIMVPTTATGVRDTQIANGTRLRNDLDAYEPMIRTYNDQKALGEKQGLWHGYRYRQPAPTTAGKWLRYMSIPTRHVVTMTEILGTVGNNGLCYAKAITSGTDIFNRIFPIVNTPGNSGIKVACAINQTEGKMEFWIYVPAVNNVAGMIFYNTFIDSVVVDNAIYHNTEFDALPTEGYTSFVYIMGSA